MGRTTYDSRHLSATAATARHPAPPAAALAAQPRRMLGRFPVALRLSRGLLWWSSGPVASVASPQWPEATRMASSGVSSSTWSGCATTSVPCGNGTDSANGFDLGRMRLLLRRLGDPYTHFPAMHIAGTKGKGSTAAFLLNIMREQGYNGRFYSSPHLLTICERISVGNDGGPVPVGLLSDLFVQAKEAIDESIESEMEP